MNKRRVVVTGVGMLTPLGLTVEETWRRLLAGESGVSKIDHFDASCYNSQISGSVKGFDCSPCLNTKEARKVATFVRYAVMAAKQAIDDAELDINPESALRMGVAVGSGIGGLPMIESTYHAWHVGGPRKISPFFIPGAIINMAAGFLSMKFGFQGPNIAMVTACTTGAHNIGYAARTISYGDADVMVAGGAEMATSPLGIGGFAAMRALSTRNDEPERASRPWDQDRDGFVLGDGAGVLVMEEYEHAKARGAKIYAELTGFGMSADAAHMTLSDPDGIGQSRAIENAFADAGCAPEEIQYLNAHSTSTLQGDDIELRAIKRAFGQAAYQGLAVSSTKSMTGHLLGAAGAVEAIFSVLALRDQAAPPTINLDNPGPECDLDLIPHKTRHMPMEVVMSNSFGFGGTNASLIFKACE